MTTSNNPTAEVLPSLRSALLASSSPAVRESSERFFKEPVKFYGVTSAAVRGIAREHFARVKKQGKAEIFALCEALLKTGYFEEAMIAFHWADRLSGTFEERDFNVLEGWLKRYVDNWAVCDTLCNHAIGSFVDTYPCYVKRLKQWACSQNRWLRRAASVTLIIPARRGRFRDDIFAIADLLLNDSDDLVQKGYGWMLKEASKPWPREVFEFVQARKTKMPRTALRYAIEKLPAEMRKRAMER